MKQLPIPKTLLCPINRILLLRATLKNPLRPLRLNSLHRSFMIHLLYREFMHSMKHWRFLPLLFLILLSRRQAFQGACIAIRTVEKEFVPCCAEVARDFLELEEVLFGVPVVEFLLGEGGAEGESSGSESLGLSCGNKLRFPVWIYGFWRGRTQRCLSAVGFVFLN